MTDKNTSRTENRPEGTVDDPQGGARTAADGMRGEAGERRPADLQRGQAGAGGSGDDAELQSVAQSRSDRAAGTSS